MKWILKVPAYMIAALLVAITGVLLALFARPALASFRLDVMDKLEYFPLAKNRKKSWKK